MDTLYFLVNRLQLLTVKVHDGYISYKYLCDKSNEYYGGHILYETSVLLKDGKYIQGIEFSDTDTYANIVSAIEGESLEYAEIHDTAFVMYDDLYNYACDKNILAYVCRNIFEMIGYGTSTVERIAIVEGSQTKCAV